MGIFFVNLRDLTQKLLELQVLTKCITIIPGLPYTILHCRQIPGSEMRTEQSAICFFFFLFFKNNARMFSIGMCLKHNVQLILTKNKIC